MLSQTVEYAFRATMFLASLEPGTAVNSETIAARTKVPHGYLSKVLRDLVVAELVWSLRGPNGGFALARPPEQVSMLDVVNAVDPIRRIEKCPLGNPAHLKLCPLHQRIDGALALIETQFRETSLAEIVSWGRKSTDRCKVLVAATVKGKSK
ncbi:MAG: Rrf2 family transcriptional regulator [Planctomycetes bacterium]|nr:Rrf2 family transcriptional regulator [Planctomycetota bacterium]